MIVIIILYYRLIFTLTFFLNYSKRSSLISSFTSYVSYELSTQLTHTSLRDPSIIHFTGMAADKLQCHKSMLVTASILSGVVHCLLLFVPHANEHLPPANVVLSCDPSSTVLRACPYGRNRSFDGQEMLVVEINVFLSFKS